MRRALLLFSLLPALAASQDSAGETHLGRDTCPLRFDAVPFPGRVLGQSSTGTSRAHPDPNMFRGASSPGSRSGSRSNPDPGLLTSGFRTRTSSGLSRTWVFLLSASPAPALSLAGGVGPVVSLKHGRVRGGYVHVRGSQKQVKQYLAIPFARPPVGALRLAAPREPEPWDGEREGTQQPPM